MTDKPTLILGVDGKIHSAPARSVTADCGARPLRVLGEHETWWRADERRICLQCFEPVEPDDEPVTIDG